MTVDIDFARELKPYPSWLRWGLLAVGATMLGLLAYLYNQTQTQIAQQNNLLQAKQPINFAPVADPHIVEATAAASRAQLGLQTPWLGTLDYLAQVKAQHAAIQLLGVTPNRNKGEIIIVGEAKQFESITAFLEDVKKSPPFADAVLQNQRLIEPENGGSAHYQFNALLTWRTNAAETL